MSKVVLLGLYGWVSIQIALRLFDLVRCHRLLLCLSNEEKTTQVKRLIFGFHKSIMNHLQGNQLKSITLMF